MCVVSTYQLFPNTYWTPVKDGGRQKHRLPPPPRFCQPRWVQPPPHPPNPPPLLDVTCRRVQPPLPHHTHLYSPVHPSRSRHCPAERKHTVSVRLSLPGLCPGASSGSNKGRGEEFDVRLVLFLHIGTDIRGFICLNLVCDFELRLIISPSRSPEGYLSPPLPIGRDILASVRSVRPGT